MIKQLLEKTSTASMYCVQNCDHLFISNCFLQGAKMPKMPFFVFLLTNVFCTFLKDLELFSKCLILYGNWCREIK